jgi:hypothetical protein
VLVPGWSAAKSSALSVSLFGEGDERLAGPRAVWWDTSWLTGVIFLVGLGAAVPGERAMRAARRRSARRNGHGCSDAEYGQQGQEPVDYEPSEHCCPPM